MTKLEKMARDYDNAYCRAEVDHDDRSMPYPGPYGASFVAGFRAAREMAVSSILDGCSRETKDQAFIKIHCSLAGAIKAMGEDVVTLGAN